MAQPSGTMRIKNRPRLRTLDPTMGERHASWLELFFDLVFVLAVSQVAKTLAEHADWGGMLKYLALFIPVWWSWVGYTFYSDRFETDETTYRILTFTGMLAVAALALCLGNAFSGTGDLPFVVCYVLVRGVLIALYIRAAYYVPLARSYARHFIRGFGIAAGLWVVSMFLPPPARYYVWAAAVLTELATPLVNLKRVVSLPLDRSHIPERLGLFTIIVLGEAVIATAMGASQTDWTIPTVATAAIGFAMAAAIWWINFDFVEDSAVDSSSLFARFIYLYGHFFIVASIVAVGIGVEHAIKETSDAHLHLPTLALLGGGIGAYLAAITVIKIVSDNCNLFYARIASLVVSLLLIYAGQFLPPLVSVAGFFLILASGVWLENRFGVEVRNESEPQHLTPCEHAGEMQVFEPRSTEGCEECVKNNYKWIHLRLCLSCGHVGCCESSIYTHASKHFHATSHPVIASLEPNEFWAWCYEDDRFVPLAQPLNDKREA
ncbi:MAG TPA: low temperature requirement protein A [Pyrinomonadaceae bacterium]|nr:low temperature requirement protein A [Pyrinomonadaceae bacterium]